MITIKKSILLIAALCFSLGFSFADVNDNTGNTGKTGTGTFNASILEPLKIHDIQPQSIGPEEYVRGANYPLMTDFGYPICQYTIHGQKNRNFYIKVVGSSVGVDGKETKTLDNGHITLFVTWKINTSTGGYSIYGGSNNIPYMLFPQNGFTYGARVLTAFFTQLNIDANATPGEHIFDQTIQVDYNPGF